MKPDYSFRNINLWNIDCMEFMRDIPDKYYELAIVDPPYGIGMSGGKREYNNYEKKDWDYKIPSKNYFNELIRISENQIIWGGNYFLDFLPSTRCVLIWDKTLHGNTFADGEMAWTSFNKNLRIYPLNICFNQGYRFHPTQKPILLYKWIIENYAKKGDKIFDSHGGSFSLACACLDLGFSFDGTEIDKEYFDNAVKRIKNHNQEFLSL